MSYGLDGGFPEKGGGQRVQVMVEVNTLRDGEEMKCGTSQKGNPATSRCWMGDLDLGSRLLVYKKA